MKKDIIKIKKKFIGSWYPEHNRVISSDKSTHGTALPIATQDNKGHYYRISKTGVWAGVEWREGCNITSTGTCWTCYSNFSDNDGQRFVFVDEDGNTQDRSVFLGFPMLDVIQTPKVPYEVTGMTGSISMVIPVNDKGEKVSKFSDDIVDYKIEEIGKNAEFMTSDNFGNTYPKTTIDWDKSPMESESPRSSDVKSNCVGIFDMSDISRSGVNYPPSSLGVSGKTINMLDPAGESDFSSEMPKKQVSSTMVDEMGNIYSDHPIKDHVPKKARYWVSVDLADESDLNGLSITCDGVSQPLIGISKIDAMIDMLFGFHGLSETSIIKGMVKISSVKVSRRSHKIQMKVIFGYSTLIVMDMTAMTDSDESQNSIKSEIMSIIDYFDINEGTEFSGWRSESSRYEFLEKFIGDIATREY